MRCRIGLISVALALLASEARADGWLYWSSRGVGVGTGEIARCDPDDCAATRTTIVSGIDPTAIDIDPVDEEVYWLDFTTGTIRKAPAAGGSPVLVFDPSPGFAAFSMALDPVGRKIYWQQNAADRIARANLDGSGLETVVTLTGGACPNVCAPIGIAVDGSGGFVYWGDGGGDHVVRRRDTALSAPGENVVTTPDAPAPVALDPANDRLFTATNTGLRSGAISTPPNGSVALAPASANAGDTLVIDAADGLLYVAIPSSNKIQRCSTSDCDELSDLTDVITGETSISGTAFLTVASVPALPSRWPAVLLAILGLTWIMGVVRRA